MNHSIKHNYFLGVFICCCMYGTAFAQSNEDSLLLYKEYYRISKSYQQSPLQAKIVFKKTTNFIQSSEDSSSNFASFYIHKTGAYIQYGDLEQLVTDSLVLFVSHLNKKFILMRSNPLQIQKFKELSALSNLPKSSFDSLAKKYQVEKITVSKNEILIRLSSRKHVRGSALSNEVVEITYNTLTENPVVARTIKRKLIPAFDTNQFGKEYVDKYKVHLENNGDYIIKEYTDEFVFQSIAHEEAVDLPVHLNQRITKNNEGQYIPVKEYQEYSISIQ